MFCHFINLFLFQNLEMLFEKDLLSIDADYKETKLKLEQAETGTLLVYS